MDLRPDGRAALEPVLRLHRRHDWACLGRWSIGSYWSLVGMSIAAIGFYGTKGPFWAIPSIFLTGMAAASFAWINSIGNLGGFLGPTIVGWVRDSTGTSVPGSTRSQPSR
jgi:nitrate/nitrite transporter NarK